MNFPLLSVAIPAYNRPEWFERALRSIMTLPPAEQKYLEIVVSDDSTKPDCQEIFNACMAEWLGPRRYVSNSPSLGMAGNWNNCAHIAIGEFVLILHDDDYLEPDGPESILVALRENGEYRALLFGVNVVIPQERIKKRQHFKEKRYLDREEALKQVLFNSSFVRFPGIVLRRSIFDQVGYFDETVGGIADIHLWVRIFHACGVLCIPIVTANYTVHANALTMNMFNKSVVKELINLFNWIESQNWLPQDELDYCKTNYFNQFVLAGSFRYIKQRNFKLARETLRLLENIPIRNHGLSLKWRIVRQVETILLQP